MESPRGKKPADVQTTESLFLRRSVRLSQPLQAMVLRMWKQVIRETDERQLAGIEMRPFDKLHMNFIDYGHYLFTKALNPPADRLKLADLLLPEANDSITATVTRLKPRPGVCSQRNRRPGRLTLIVESPELDASTNELQQRLTDNGYPIVSQQLTARNIVLGELRPEVDLGRNRMLGHIASSIPVEGSTVELGPAEIATPPALVGHQYYRVQE